MPALPQDLRGAALLAVSNVDVQRDTLHQRCDRRTPPATSVLMPPSLSILPRQAQDKSITEAVGYFCDRIAGVCPFPPDTISPKEAAQPAGVAAFYKLKPGTVVPMHNGPTNQRLKCQVGAAASCRRRSRRL